MSLAPDTRFGPYQIVAPLGAGGMGEVYRARDTRLDRDVAIKILPAHLTRNAEFRQRFEREAKSISQLSHPHICTLFDVGHHDGTEFLVMEMLEGESLAQRLSKGPLPLEEVLKLGAQIAAALGEAHRKGVVHRDLKPGNIMLTRGGAKLLDFGLAKSAGIVDSDPSAVTVSQPLTSKGTILGTFQYMAPEQLEGQEADARTDIFALGAMLYEMATGRRAFEGASRASLIASIMSSQPRPITELRPMTPPALDRLIRRCLAKDPDERWQSSADVADELRWIAEIGTQVGPPLRAALRRRESLAWLLAATAVAFGMVMTLSYVWRTSPETDLVRSLIFAPDGTSFVSVGYGPREAGPVSISPNGRKLTFVARDADGREQLWMRSLDSFAAKLLPGTENAIYPFWSPDNSTIGFFADGKLKKIDTAGGPPVTVCDAPSGRGGTWNEAGVIVFAPRLNGPLHRVAADGGRPEPATMLDESTAIETHRWPFFLPDGRHFLYFVRYERGPAEQERNSIMLGSLDGRVDRHLLYAGSNAAYASGYVLFAHDGALMAQPFDTERLEFTASAFPLAQQVQYDSGYSHAVFSASSNGVLVYQAGSGTGRNELVWISREGTELATVGERASYFAPRISPDGRLAAVVIDHVQNVQADIWILDLLSATGTRFTFDHGNDVSPIWSPDGNSLVFASDRSGVFDLYRKSISGLADEEPVLITDTDDYPNGWSPDGERIIYDVKPPARGRTTQAASDVWTLDLSGHPTPVPFLRMPVREAYAVFSPDGRWVAYQSDETGRDEVYVTPFPGPGRKWQVSTDGGVQPKWRHDGKELYYISMNSKLTAVEVSAGESTFQVGRGTALFDIIRSTGGAPYDSAPDGERFLVVKDVMADASSPLFLVVNWTAELNEN